MGIVCYVLPRRRVVWLPLYAVLLAGCTRPVHLTYIDLRATAAVAGCWPGNYPTPNPVTATPHPRPPSPVETPPPLPTTTAFPRCTPVPGAPALAPYPTAVSTPVLYPTQRPIIINGGNERVTALELPFLHHVEVAVHPSAGWAAVASVWPDDQHGSDGGPSRRIFVRVFDPRAKAWGLTQQVNPPPAEDGNGMYGGVALAISGDGTVHVVWGGAFTPGKPVWYAASTDYGATWSAPVPIGRNCYSVAKMAATLDGQLVVLALCTPPSGSWSVRPGFIVRRSDGTWLPQEEIDVDGRWGSLVVLGDGADARAVALLASESSGDGYVIQKRLLDPSPWRVQSVNLVPSGMAGASTSYYLFRGLAFRRPNGGDSILFTWSIYGANGVHALTSLDGGASWGGVESVA
ncbi:MAG: glycoside hydrolase, partial [Chloroflexota bacterium]|nr:glycoside hydrolase [Chloroflexota bacterium]